MRSQRRKHVTNEPITFQLNLYASIALSVGKVDSAVVGMLKDSLKINVWCAVGRRGSVLLCHFDRMPSVQVEALLRHCFAGLIHHKFFTQHLRSLFELKNMVRGLPTMAARKH